MISQNLYSCFFSLISKRKIYHNNGQCPTGFYPAETNSSADKFPVEKYPSGDPWSEIQYLQSVSNLNTVKSFYCLKSFPGENIGVHWAPWSGCHGHFIDLGLSLPPLPDDSKLVIQRKDEIFAPPKFSEN